MNTHITNRSWTQEEIERLTQLSAQGATLVRASAALGRRKGAVYSMARKLGLSLVGFRQVRAKMREAAEQGWSDVRMR